MSIVAPAAQKESRSLSSEAAFRELADHLQTTRERVLAQRFVAGLCAAGSALAIGVALLALVDYWFELGTGLRGLSLAVIVAAVGYQAFLGWRRWIASYNLASAACDTEATAPAFGQRLRTTLDYEDAQSRPAAASPGLLAALHRETHAVSQKVDWDGVVDGRTSFKAFLVAAAVVLGWGVALLMVPEYRTATARSLLLPFDYTTVEFSPQTATVHVGESVTVAATVSGRPIESAELRYRAAGSDNDWTVLELMPVEDEREPAGDAPRRLSGELTVLLDKLEHDLEFEVVAGPRPLPPGAIRVLQPLTLESSEANVIPPEYSGLKPRTFDSLDLKVPEGSTIELALNLSRAPAEATLTKLENPAAKAEGDSTAPAVAPLAIEGSVLRGTIVDLRESASFTIDAKSADGITLDPARLNIRVVPDRKPEIRFVEPSEELVVTPTTDVPMVVEASDDIGLHKVGIQYRINGGDVRTLWEEDALGSTDPFQAALALLLEEHDLTYQDGVTYFAFAEDDYFGEARRTTTPLRFIDIRPYKRSFQLVEGGGSCSQCSGALEELIARQRQNLTQAFAVRDEYPLPAETAQRLIASESDLLEKATEFSDGLAERGIDVPTLKKAVFEMQDAIGLLKDDEVSGAVEAEQQALAALIHARENLRKKLNQSSSQSSQACRKFDREQMQKLRLPAPKKQDQQQKLAEARSKLEELAQRERQWAQQCQNCSNKSSSSSSSSKASQSQSPNQSQQTQSQNSQTTQAPQSGDKQEQSSQSQNEQSSENEAGQKPQDGAKPDGAPTKEEIAQAQEKIRSELAALREQLDKLNAAGAAAKNQADQADESMRQGLEQLAQDDPQAAAREGRRSAEQLEKLSEHLAAMNARDFGERLGQAGKLARELGDRQQSLEQKLEGDQGTKIEKGRGEASRGNSNASKEGSEKSNGQQAGDGQLAREERALAGEAEMLADLLDALRRDSALEKGNIREGLGRIQAENPPRDIAGGMQQAADDLKAERRGPARQGVAQARERLHELGRALGVAQSDYAQPQLQELIDLEEQLAALMQQLQRKGASEKEAAQQKWNELERPLDRLASADKRLAEALRRLREGQAQPGQKPGESNSTAAQPAQSDAQLAPNSFRPRGGQQPPEGHYNWLQLGQIGGVQQVDKVLQAKIQEAILAGALQESDQTVPPEYKKLVEQYYRALSDDLR